MSASRAQQARENPRISFPLPGQGAQTVGREVRAMSLNVRSRHTFVRLEALKERGAGQRPAGRAEMVRGHCRVEVAIALATRTRISRHRRIHRYGCGEPMTRGAPVRPKRQGSDSPRGVTAGEWVSGTRGTAKPSAIPAPFGLGKPGTPGTELDRSVPQNWVGPLPSAGVGSGLPRFCPRTHDLRHPSPSGPVAFKSQVSNQ